MDWHMEEQMGYVLMTLFVPTDVKRRMDAVEKMVDWSAVAWPVFERKVDELESIKEKKTLHEVVARLRASKTREEEADYREGEKDGRSWAENLAEVKALERLEGVREQDGPEWRSLFEASTDSTIPAERLMDIIVPPSRRLMYPRGNRLVGFWDDVADRDVPDTDSYVRGFADGALAVWLAVKEQVEA